MKRVFASSDGGQTGLVQSVLDAAGIAYEVRNEALAQVAGPFLPFVMELWILRDQDYEEALSVIQSKELSSVKPE